MPRTYLRQTAAMTAALSLTVCGCAADEPDLGDESVAAADDEPPVADESPVADDPPVADEPPAADASAAGIEVTLVEYAFEGLPETIEAGTVLSVVNASEQELHELVAYRLPDDETRSVEELTQLPRDEFGAVEEELGMPATALFAGPGDDQTATVGDGTLSEPGRYAILCGIQTGEALEEAGDDSEGPPADGGPRNFVRGMYAELTVE